MKDNYMRAVQDNRRIKLDPRTKIAVLLIINISAFTVNSWYVMVLCAAIPLSLLLLRKLFLPVLVFTVVYFVSLFSFMLFLETSRGAVSILVGLFSGVINRMGPGLLMGYYLLSTTTVSELIASMERIRIPKQIIIPLSVMFRFFPTIKEESSSITDAMQMRGIGFGKSKGGLISIMEYRLVPLFISCIKIGEELSCSALTRGLGNPAKRTNLCKIGFGVIDLFYGILTAVTALLFIYVKGN